MLPAVTSFLICAKNSFELTRYFPSWNAVRSTMSAMTSALTKRLIERKIGFSLKASMKPPDPLPPLAAGASATLLRRATNILDAPFLLPSDGGFAATKKSLVLARCRDQRRED